jgi:hypothetical protein
VWIHLGEYQPWLPLIGLEYGFPLGIVVGDRRREKGFRPKLIETPRRSSMSEMARFRQLP